MNTISVYNSLWIKVRQALFGLFISSHTVVNSSETSVSRGYVNEFIQTFRCFAIGPSPQSSNDPLFKPLWLNSYLLELES